MDIKIINPVDETPLEVSIEPEDYNGDLGWRVIFPSKDSFVMIEKDGEWNVMDETDINPDLINAIADGLRPHSRYV